MVDIRLSPRCTTHNEYWLVFIVEQNLVEINAVVLVLSPLIGVGYT